MRVILRMCCVEPQLDSTTRSRCRDFVSIANGNGGLLITGRYVTEAKVRKFIGEKLGLAGIAECITIRRCRKKDIRPKDSMIVI